MYRTSRTPRWNTRNTPKVVGGITETCRRVAVAIYGPAIERLVPVSSTEAAELVKILENTFRSVNIGLVNEMAIVCEKLGVNVWEVIDAAATKPFGFMKLTPGPGVGGHCIPPAALKGADCVIIVTDHSNVDYASVAPHAQLVVDTRNALPGAPGPGKGA